MKTLTRGSVIIIGTHRFVYTGLRIWERGRCYGAFNEVHKETGVPLHADHTVLGIVVKDDGNMHFLLGAFGELPEHHKQSVVLALRKEEAKLQRPAPVEEDDAWDEEEDDDDAVDLVLDGNVVRLPVNAEVTHHGVRYASIGDTPTLCMVVTDNGARHYRTAAFTALPWDTQRTITALLDDAFWGDDEEEDGIDGNAWKEVDEPDEDDDVESVSSDEDDDEDLEADEDEEEE